MEAPRDAVLVSNWPAAYVKTSLTPFGRVSVVMRPMPSKSKPNVPATVSATVSRRPVASGVYVVVPSASTTERSAPLSVNVRSMVAVGRPEPLSGDTRSKRMLDASSHSRSTRDTPFSARSNRPNGSYS